MTRTRSTRRAARTPKTTTRLRSRFPPGPALAVGVLIVALIALALLDRGPGQGSPQAPAPGEGSTVRLLPPGRSDAGAAQYASRLHAGGTLLGPRARARHRR
jgi:hypothetical protein